MQLFRTVADGYAKRGLRLALALVAAGALLATLTPLALELVIDALAIDAVASLWNAQRLTEKELPPRPSRRR
jgi:hypothetical protein